MTRQQETHTTAQAALDVGGHYPWRLLRDHRLALDLSSATSPYFIAHLHGLLTLGGTHCLETLAQAQQSKQLHFAVSGAAFQLEMNHQPVSALQLVDGALVPAPRHSEYQLALSETRALGRPLRADVLAKLPYNRAARAGFNPAIHAPITDLHTHSSAQITGADLLQAAIEQDAYGAEPICYPIELLSLLQVDDPGQLATRMKGRGFNPMKDDGLLCEQEGAECDGIRASELNDRQKAALIAKMDIAADATMSFSDFDREMYRYRNPFVKHPALTKPILRKIAEDYQRMGVRYAELSTGSMMDPQWFAEMAEAVAEIEAAGGPKLRFLVGIPRNASPQQTLIAIEKIKYLARHPTIVGADLLGYESNKTSEFNWALSHLAQWAMASTGTELDPAMGWDFQRDFIIRVHAGETEKNDDNVRDAINLAADHGVRLRIGHGLHVKLDALAEKNLERIIAQGDPDQFATERCMDSNQVYRTKIFVHNQPPFLSPSVPRFLGTDGGGAIGTGPVQLAYSALAAGMALNDLAVIHRFEEGYIARQAEREEVKTSAFQKLYPGGLQQFLDGYQQEAAKIPRLPSALMTYLPAAFRNKTPLLIGGASGSSWVKMDQQDKDTVICAMEFLVRTCDPKKTYFVMGRVQIAGVSKALDYAIKRWNAAHPTEKFSVLGRFAGASKQPTADLADTIDWVQDIPQGREYVPASMTNFIAQHGGYALFFNGSDFTAEMAYGAMERGIPHAVHDPIKRSDKMSEVAENTTAPVFRDFDGFVDGVMRPSGPGCLFADAVARSELLRHGLDIDAIKQEAGSRRKS